MAEAPRKIVGNLIYIAAQDKHKVGGWSLVSHLQLKLRTFFVVQGDLSVEPLHCY